MAANFGSSTKLHGLERMSAADWRLLFSENFVWTEVLTAVTNKLGYR